MLLFNHSNSMLLTGMPMTLFPINENHSGENSASHEKINPRPQMKNNGFSAAAAKRHAIITMLVKN